MRVGIAALGAAESREHFDTDLAARGIQPVWVEIENRSPVTLYLLSSAIDPAFFSARETAYQTHRAFRGAANRRMDEFLEAQALDTDIPSGRTQSGFVFTNHDERTKFITIQLYGERRTHTFHFVVDVPGIRTDYDAVNFDTLYPANQVVELDDEAALGKAHRAIPAVHDAAQRYRVR